MLRQSERIRSANTAFSTAGWAAGLQLAGAEHSTPWVATRSPTPMRYSNRVAAGPSLRSTRPQCCPELRRMRWQARFSRLLS
jgi:hypothetical protein